MSMTLDGADAGTVDLDELTSRLAGPVWTPGEDRYDRLSNPWNLAVRPRPALVVEAMSAQDVLEAVRYAGRVGMAVAVQATGHGIAADLEGALLVHTARLDECVIDPAGWARVGAGVQWQRVLDAAAPLGFTGLCGSAPHVGVVGYTTGGGLGPMARTYGAASDLVRAVEVVTGDGELRRASADENADLFWGVRGGKGALGIVTAIEFDLVPLSEVYAGALYFDGVHARDVLHAWSTWCRDLPEAATTSIALLQLPPMPGVPEPLAGRPTVAVRFVWTGDPAEGERHLSPMRSVAPQLIDAVQVIPTPAMGMVHADPVDPMPVHEGADLLRDLPADAVDALLAVAGPESGSPQVIVEVRQLGGAFARAPRADSALCHRDAAFTLLTIGVPVPPVAEAVVAHSESVRTALGEWTMGATLPNFSAGVGGERLARSYDPATLTRLTDLAARFDPQNVYRVGQVPVRTLTTETHEEN